MSFFGFDPALPRDRGHPSQAPGFGATPDHFAGLSKAGGGDDDGIDFEDTYDGLGDALDEKDDVFNDETFGGGDEPVAVGRDFDFHGATARVANVIEEEHEVFSRHAHKKMPPLEPAVEETPRLPDLQPDMSLWASSVPTSLPRYQEPQPTAYVQPVAPGSKKVLSLEEVEAQILAASQKPTPRPPASLQSENQQLPMQQMQTMRLDNAPPSGMPLHQFQGAQDLHQFPQQQLPPHLQQMIQRNEALQNAPNMGNMSHAFHAQSAPALPQQPPEPSMAREQPPASQGRNQYGMTTHLPAHQLQSMSDIERQRYLEEESKRLKRNHKIAQLARYNGLMTPSDKNFITRIQLQQLVSINNAEDNQNEDFYYIVHSAIRARANPQQPLNQFAQTYLFRQGNRGGNRRQENHLQRMEQQVARAVAAAKARPKASQLVLEGSLGKISFSNVKTPRPMLNIKKSDGPTSADNVRKIQKLPRSSADRKSLLRIIENVYDALLELEIHERDRAKLSILQPGQAAQPSHLEWGTKRDRLADKLWSEMKIMEPIDSASHYTHPFIAILSYSKMKRAIPRIFRHLDAEQRLTVLTMIVVHLHILDVVKHGVYMPDETQLPSAFREEIEMFSSCVLPPLLGYIYEAPLSIVVALLGVILERVDIRAVSRTKIGLAFLTTFSSRAELVKQSGQTSEQELKDWQMMYNRLFDALQGHWMECFPPTGKFVDDVYVWQFLASMAVGANMNQQQALVGAVKDRVMENVMASKTLPPELGAQKSANVNLFMRAMGLDVELLG